MTEQEKPTTYTREYFIEQGRLGGEKVKEMYGLKHYEKMSKKAKQKKVDKSS